MRAPRPRTAVAAAAALALVGGAAGLRASPTARSATPAPAPRSITIAVSGDLLIHAPEWQRAQAYAHGRGFDFAPMLAAIRPYIRAADLAICHVETPMTPRPPVGYPVFNTPTQLARAIRATGWRACDTASNHSLDQGQYGVDQTGRALDRAGVLHTGSFPSATARDRTLMMSVHGIRVALLAYTEMTNGERLPHPWSVNLARAARVRADARAARRRGAQVVIATFHWGTQYQSAPSAFQSSLAGALAGDPDITAIVGQHVHVVQPIRRVRGKFVVFGEGNLLSDQTAACCQTAAVQDGMIVLLHVTLGTHGGARVASIEYVPVWVRHPDFTVLPVGDALRSHAASAAALRASYRRTVAVVGRRRGLLEPIPRSP